MKPWEQYAEQPAKPWERYGAAPEKPLSAKAGEVVRDVAAGALRGAGSIGATLLWPIDKATDLIKGDREKNLSGLVTGEQPLSRNEERRQAMDEALGLMGANTDSASYQVGKVGTEIAGTLGVGGAMANAAARVPGMAAPMVQAIRTAGFSSGGATGAAGLATRTAGGALVGGASAALVDPETAGTGMLVGGALPGALQAAGVAGRAAGRVIAGPAQSPQMAQAVKAAQAAGYVIPPTQAKESLGNRVLEGVAGKISTAQNASARNQKATNSLAAKALGLPAGSQITPDVLTNIRTAAGQAYDAVASAGTVTPGAAYDRALDGIAAQAVKASQGFPNARPSPVIDLVESLRSPSFDASAAVAKLKELRSAADDAFRTGNTDVGRASKQAAKALEDVLEAHLSATGQQGLLAGFKDARTLIAKTYTVEKALNPASGTIDARKLAAELRKGKPISGELKQVAEFAATFPKAAQPVENMGSLPQISPLDFFGAGGIAALTSQPWMLGIAATRPAARAAALSPLVQSRLLQQQGGAGAFSRLPFEAAEQLGFRAAPVAISSDR